ncbi:putative thymidine phosphorylase [Tsuneonella deserti]|uniref:Putative thymidine phosphorylase n=1 Tax=Tsuneonella deserti TaxID=2035528 RepID=A0ABQ1RZ89_9SPHN|nr:thymidine phosphorylase family protein [Tsuneonella deserti]GGD88033.1 putative thymidine phosphorylase [Tsuneonella deserti]
MHDAVQSSVVLRTRRLRLETQQEPIVLLHADCPIARSVGFTARAQVELVAGGRSALATMYQVSDGLIGEHEVGLSEDVWSHLDVPDGTPVNLRHPLPVASMSAVRAKVYGHRLDDDQIRSIIRDVATERYSDVELATFITAFSSHQADFGEMVTLTRAMVEVGEGLTWPGRQIVDKHCVGGLPANRTSPLLVAIAAAAGLTIPKTSSRAITSPAGTADTMETMAPVNLDIAAMRKVVEREGGCVVWGSNVGLSPADDIIIRVERAVGLDSSAQLVASVLSKKLAAGSTHVLIDLPVGPTAKVRSPQDASQLSEFLTLVGKEVGLDVRPIVTDGSQPVGNGIGPALEAHDVLAVLRCENSAPADLRTRALLLAGELLELGGAAEQGAGQTLAASILDDGRALRKFLAICAAQGGFREPPVAPLRHDLVAPEAGRLASIDNRLLAKLAKLAGAPAAASAGVRIHVKLGDEISRGQPLLTVHAETPGELAYALEFAAANARILQLTEA